MSDEKNKIEEEFKNEPSSIEPKLNSKYSRRDTATQQISEFESPFRAQGIIDDVSTSGIDSTSLTLTLN